MHPLDQAVELGPHIAGKHKEQPEYIGGPEKKRRAKHPEYALQAVHIHQCANHATRPVREPALVHQKRTLPGKEAGERRRAQ